MYPRLRPLQRGQTKPFGQRCAVRCSPHRTSSPKRERNSLTVMMDFRFNGLGFFISDILSSFVRLFKLDIHQTKIGNLPFLGWRQLVNEVSVVAEAQPATESSGSRQWFSPAIKRWLREPLLHFLLLGVVLFAAYAYTHRGRGGVESSRQIALGLDELRQMDMYFESQWHRQPTPAEFQAMVEDRVREEVLYREALAMGLDKDDTIVKRRMAQKMQFLAEDVAAAHEPSTAELKAWFEKNSNKFALPSRYSFRHLYFSPDKRGKNTQDDAAKALTKIAGQPEDSKLAASLADPFMFQNYYGDRAPEALAKEFGPQFVVALERLKPGSWQGPV